MSRFDNVDLSRLPPPNIIEPLDFETILAEDKALYASFYPEHTADLESDPVIKVLELLAFKEVNLRGRVNDAARAMMLAFATGEDLDQIAARYGVERQTIDPGDPDAVPPVPPTKETDAAFLRRVQLAPEALSVAGSRGGYIFHGLSAGETPASVDVLSPEPGTVTITYTFDPDQTAALAKDVDAYIGNPGEVEVVVMGWDGDGTPPQSLLDAVEAHLTSELVRPLGDTPIVRPVEILPYAIDAVLELAEAPHAPIAKAAAEQALQTYVDAQHHIGLRVTDSGVHEALTVTGVQKVRLNNWADIEPEAHQAAFCTGFTVGTEVQHG